MLKTSKLSKLWLKYLEHRRDLKNPSEETLDAENKRFENHIVTYFVGIHHQKDPTKWHSLVPGLLGHLSGYIKGKQHIKRILGSLKRFSEFLVYYGHMTFPFVIITPSRKNPRTTPLKLRLYPKDVISFANRHIGNENGLNFSLTALLGYFSSLRPSELYALNREDFLTGEDAVTHCPTRDHLVKANLGSKLGIVINKALKNSGVVPILKTDASYGVVNIWDADAARLIASILRGLPDGMITPFSLGWLNRAWREKAKPGIGVTVHDFRRASGLYLGRDVRLDLTLLQEHMRHAEISTTIIYTRIPATPSQNVVANQDFDDVG
jgi:integrase